MQRFLLTGFIIWFSYSLGWGQLYSEKKSQHRFAQTYFSLSHQYIPQSGNLQWWDAAAQQQGNAAMPQQFIPRIGLGGLHFWGHLDFNMNFPITQLGKKELAEGQTFRFRSGSDFKANFYPWPVKFNTIRPFIGVGLNFQSLQMKNEQLGWRFDGFIQSAATAGLSFAFHNWQINAEAVWSPFNRKQFNISPSQVANFKLPPLLVNLGIRRYFDTTIGNEKHKEDGSTTQLEQILQTSGKLNSVSIGVAPSSAFFFAKPDFQESRLRHLPKFKSNVFIDWSLGYLFHKAKTYVDINYKNYSMSVESFNLEVIIRRQALAAESIFFLADYNGFVPFIGPSLSFERWAMGEFDGEEQVGSVQRSQLISPGIVFGWDISPSPLDTWVLRTNLRYYPFQKIANVEGRTSRVDQFEFNFIQFVIYPQRMYHIPKAKKEFY